MIKGLDHVVVLVTDLDKATKDYSTLGFTIVPGGTHADGATKNALISFSDGSYIELISFLKNSPQHRWWQYTQQGEGLIDFALLPSKIEEDVSSARNRGLELEGPFPGGRIKPQGEEIKWQTAVPINRELPFLCADVTPRNRRVPEGLAVQHPNKVSGISRVAVYVENLEKSGERLKALLGLSPQPFDNNQGFKAINFNLGVASIILLSDQANTPDRKLREGPYSLQLKTNLPTGQKANLEPSLCHGVRFLQF